MTEDIFIVGAGGFAKDVFLILDRLRAQGTPLRCAGFVDRDPGGPDLSIGSERLPVFDQGSFMETHSGAKLALGVAFPELITKLRSAFEGWTFETLVDPSVHVPASVSVDQGTVIGGRVQLSVDISIGACNAISAGVIIGHDTRMGDGNVINPGAVLSGRVILGDGSLVGSSATILQGLKVGNDCTVGAGAVVTKDVPSGALVKGIPARG